MTKTPRRGTRIPAWHRGIIPVIREFEKGRPKRVPTYPTMPRVQYSAGPTEPPAMSIASSCLLISS